MTLAKALDDYYNTLAGNASQEVQIELRRFARWCGSERPLDMLTPPEVAQYAESVSSSGGNLGERLGAIKAFLSYLKKKKLIDVSLASHVKLPRTRAPRGTAASREEPLYLSQEGYDALRQEVKGLKAQRIDIAADIRRAAADKDFRENAPLEAAREHQGHVESRIRELEQRLRRAVTYTGRAPGQRIQVGRRVTLRNEQTGKEFVYTLVDPTEADPTQGRLSVASPVGRALLRRGAGDRVQVAAPRGNVSYHITAVE